MDSYSDCDFDKTGIRILVNQGEPITVQCEDPTVPIISLSFIVS